MTGKKGLGLTIVVLEKPVPTVALTVEVEGDDINILQAHVNKHFYYMTNSYRPDIKKFDWFKAGL